MAIVGPSFNDLVALGAAELQSARPELVPVDGSVALADLHAAAAMADANERMSALRFRNTFLDGAKGDDLTVLVRDRYNLDRSPATAAQVTVEFSRAATVLAGTIPAGTQLTSTEAADGSRVTFTTDAAVAVAVADGGPFSVVATAQLTGPSGNVAAGAVAVISDALFDTFTVTNPTAAAGGNNAEGDDALVRRARSYFGTLRRGTLAALEFGALTVPSVRIAKATDGELSGFATLTVSDENGASTEEMLADVRDVIDEWRAAGVLVTVMGGSAKTVDITAQIRARAGFDIAAVASDIAAAVTARVKRLQAGDPLYMDSVTATILGQYPDDMVDVVYTLVAVDGSALAAPDDLKAYAPGDSYVIRPGVITIEAVA